MKKCFTVFLIVLLVVSFFASFSFFAVPVHATSTLTLEPNANGTYSQLVEVSNSGFIFGDQFEVQDFSQWSSIASSGATFTVTSDFPHSGVYSAKASGLTANNRYVYAEKTITPATTVYERAYVCFTADFAKSKTLYYLLRLNQGGSEYYNVNLERQADGSYRWHIYLQAATTDYPSASFNLTLNAWYCVELKFVASTTVGVLSLNINGGNQISETGLNTGTAGITAVRIEAWESGASNPGTMYFDDVVVSSSAIGVENRASLVNDGSDNTALQVTANTTQIETEKIGSTAQTGTIISVTAYFRAEATDTSEAAVNAVVTSAYYENPTPQSLTASYANYAYVMNNNPNGSAWTWTAVNTMEVGARASTLGSAKQISFSEFYIVVTYLTATAPTYTLSSPSYNNTMVSCATMFSCEWTNGSDPIGMVLYSTNATGAWSWNNTATLTSIDPSDFWANFTATLTSMVGAVVEYYWIANDTSGNWNTTMANQTLTTTYIDTTPPTYSSVSVSSTVAGASCSFNCLWSDDVNVSGYVFGTNNTGTFTNDAWTSAWSSWPTASSAWANVTATLNGTGGSVVQYEWWCNDTSNNWSNSDLYNLTLTAPYRPNLQITPDNFTCREINETFNVQVNVTNAINTQGFTFTVYYDVSVLNFSGVTWGELGNGTLATVDTADGIVEGNVAGSPVTGNLWLLNMTFQADQGLVWKVGSVNQLQSVIWFHQAQLEFSDSSVLQYAEGGINQIDVNQVTYTFLPIPGDVNNDGTVDVLDLRIIAFYYGKTPADPEWPQASKYDLTNDNIIDIFDLVIVGKNFGFTYP